MTTYIVWNKSEDTAFRSAYLAETGEQIQAVPQEDLDGVRFMAGSSRITAAQASSLLNMPGFTDLSIGPELPADWIAQSPVTG